MNYLTAVLVLVGTLVGAVASFGGVAYQQRRIDHREAAAAVARACDDLTTHCIAFALRASTLMVTAQLRSGPAEGLELLLHMRKPVDPRDIHAFLAVDFDPIIRAVSTLRTSASPPVVAQSDSVLDACTDLLSAATDGKPGRRAEVGLRQKRVAESAQTLGRVRREFAALVRGERGLDPTRTTEQP